MVNSDLVLKRPFSCCLTTETLSILLSNQFLWYILMFFSPASILNSQQLDFQFPLCPSHHCFYLLFPILRQLKRSVMEADATQMFCTQPRETLLGTYLRVILLNTNTLDLAKGDSPMYIPVSYPPDHKYSGFNQGDSPMYIPVSYPPDHKYSGSGQGRLSYVHTCELSS